MDTTGIDLHKRESQLYATRSTRVTTDKRDARTRYVTIIQAFVRREGLRLASEPERTAATLAQLELPPALLVEIAPLVALLTKRGASSSRADDDDRPRVITSKTEEA